MYGGELSFYGKSQLKVVNGTLNSERYQKTILNDIKVQCDCIAFPIRNYIFMQDNAPCHNSKSTKQFLSANNIEVLDWPGNSPDLNPIEEVWNVMKKKCGRLEKNRMALWEGVCSAWYSISRQTLMKLYDEMPDRVMAVYKAKGGATAY